MARLCSGVFRLNRLQLLLSCTALTIIFYFLRGRSESDPRPSPTHAVVAFWNRAPAPPLGHSLSPRSSVTSWGAPLVWGASPLAAQRRARFQGPPPSTALVALVVGNYAFYLERFLSSAEAHFLPNRPVIYYILTDNERTLQPAPALGPGRELRVVPIAELPGWDRLHLRRLQLLADTLRDIVSEDAAEYVFCADVDLEFHRALHEEILDELVGVVHADFYGKVRGEFPYESGESAAAVSEDEGEWYYTSELYGGTARRVLSFTQGCCLLLLQDQAQGVRAQRREESYLNRCFIDHAPSCVLSPEYSGGGATPRVRSRGRGHGEARRGPG
ncbi:globoside alpha-1,3-N-acetylgalactosaminyltransferase 1-like [Eucyclogobius newberryi]|uniref:globoside alpha-1,3-N-acetylgalactosaminyltransferase 1-like n=1 Tax=Eucyclogobius newberryi TaxID=166745 RepID=UPI003B5A14E1